MIGGIPSGSYDLMVTCSDGSYATLYGISITDQNGARITITPPISGGLRVVNNTTHSVAQLYVALSSSNSWGTNQVSSSISSGGAGTIANLSPDTYDVKAVMSDGSYYTSFGVAISSGVTTILTLSPQSNYGAVKIVNNSSSTIINVYISPTTISSWGPDQLGASTISSGASFTIADMLPGNYDFKAVKANGTSSTLNNFTLNAGTTFTITVP